MAKDPSQTGNPPEDKTKNPAPSEQAAPTMAGGKGETIKVRGPEDGRRRAGLAFGPVEIEIDLSTITMEQYEAVKGDPYLKVTGP